MMQHGKKNCYKIVKEKIKVFERVEQLEIDFDVVYELSLLTYTIFTQITLLNLLLNLENTSSIVIPCDYP